MDEQHFSGDPYKTMCVVTFNGKEVGRIPASAPNAEERIAQLRRQHGNVSVDYVEDENAGLIAMLHGSRIR